MNINKKLAYLLFIMAGVLCLMSACNKDPGNESTSQTDTENSTQVNQESPKQPEPVKEVELILYSTVGDPEEEISMFVDPLNKKYSHIQVKYIRSAAATGTSIAEMFASGTKFDIFYHGTNHFVNQILEHELAYDMTDLMKKHNVDISHLEPSPTDSLKNMFNGELYGINITLGGSLIYYNKALFEKFGVSHPRDGMTWDEINDLARVMTRSEGQDRYFGMGNSAYSSQLRYNPFSIPIADVATDKPTINTDPGWKIIYEKLFLNPAIVEGYAALGSIPGWPSFSKDQNLAMIVYSTSVPLALQADITPLDWDMVSLPVFSELPESASQATGVYYGITSISENKDAAMEAIKFWVSDEFQTGMTRQGRLMSTRTGDVRKQLGVESPFPDKNWGAMTYHAFSPLVPQTEYSAKVYSVYNKYLTEIIGGTMDLNTAFRAMEDEAEKVIAEHFATK